jgi:RNase H-fold protein (predicted Holliday junction resolvase)
MTPMTRLSTVTAERAEESRLQALEDVEEEEQYRDATTRFVVGLPVTPAGAPTRRTEEVKTTK